MAYHNITIIL